MLITLNTINLINLKAINLINLVANSVRTYSNDYKFP